MGKPEAATQQGIASRNDKSSTPLGTTIFVGLRLLDPYIQYGLLAWGWSDGLIKRLGGTPLPMEGPPVALGLPYWRLTLFCMALASTIKTIFYLLYVSDAAMPVRAGLFVGFFKNFSTTINTFIFCVTATSAAKAYVNGAAPPTTLPFVLLLSIAISVLGITVETYAELQRKWFKQDPANKGKPYTGGLFSVARHINYGGYSVFKSGLGMAAAGYGWGALTLVWLIAEFRRRVIPGIDEYCQGRYGDEWTEFKKKTPYKMIPFLF